MRKVYKTMKLQELCDDYKKDIVDGPFGSNLKRVDYINTGIPVLKIQNIKSYSINSKNIDYVTENKYKELKRHSYVIGDIIMTKLGAPLGVSAIVEDIEKGLIVADLVRIRAQKINTKYLCYHLNSPNTNDFINSKQKGATRPRVRLADVRELPIYAPSASQQNQIVEILDKVFNEIEQAKQNAQKNLQNAKDLFESYLQFLFNIKNNDWEYTKLSNLCETGSGGTPLKAHKEYYENGSIPWLRSGEVNKKNIKRAGLCITEKGLNNSSAKMFPSNTVLVAMYGATAGQVGILKFASSTNQAVCGILPNNKMVPDFLYYIFLSKKEELVSQAVGNAQPNISQIKIKNTLVPNIGINKQNEIVYKLDSLFVETKKLEEIYQQKINCLEELKQSILQKAFSGELLKEESLV